MTLPVALYLMLSTDPLSLSGLIFATGLGIIHASYWIFYSKAYENGAMSHVYPIIRSAPAFVLLFAVLFLKEGVSTLGLVGILVTTIGLYTINLKSLRLSSMLEPFKSIISDEHVRFAFYALGSAVAFTVLDKIAVTLMHPIVYAFITVSIAALIYSAYLFSFRPREKDEWIEPWKNNRKNLLIASFLAAINYPLVLTAITFTNVSYVSSFKQTSVVIAVVIGHFLLKERYPLIRLVSSIIIFSGALLVAFA